ncbi:MAG: hypothetical protein ACT4PO_14130 [Actinomycetota bacterium]
MDRSFLERHRSWEDREAGIGEEFLLPEIGGARTVAVLTRPLGEAHDTGWVVCHSFGGEQMHLSRLEVMVARGLAAAGFPVLRFHGQGYGDSERDAGDVGLASHLADASDAVELMRTQPGVGSVGVLGALFGGTVAALVADRLELPSMALWEPACRGDQYIRRLLRSRVFSEMVEPGEDAQSESGVSMEQLKMDLETKGWADLNGFPLTGRAAREIAVVDLAKDLVRFRGNALVIAVSRSGREGRGISAIAGRLRELGADSHLSTVADPFAGHLGRFHYSKGIDSIFRLATAMVRETVAWARRGTAAVAG